MRARNELYAFISHLRSCPADFLQIHEGWERGPHTNALVADLFRILHGNFELPKESIPPLNNMWRSGDEDYITIQIGVWFFHHERFKNHPELASGIRTFFSDKLPALFPHVKYMQWIEDEDRSEEFVRLALECCQIRIDGETNDEALDRLDSLSTLKRIQVLAETSDSIERMKEIRRKMAEQKAREAANTYGRE